MQILKNISFENVSFKDGFWKSKYDTNKKESIKTVYERFEETGRIDALRYNYPCGKPLHKFYDSDVAKWIEAVSYLIAKDRNGYPEEEKLIDELANSMKEAQLESGYLNSYFIQVEPENIFSLRDSHELYTAGHLIEAAIAYHKATGKDTLLNVMIHFLDCVEEAFINQKTAKFYTDRHEEIELALIKLYEHTENKRFLDLCMYFLNKRGTVAEPVLGKRFNYLYCQSHMPVREQTEAVGHAVRATYLYTGMIEAAHKTGDEGLYAACRTLFDDIVKRKMYITGGIGSGKQGEYFTVAYDLPNLEAYSESCAAIGLMLFAHGMSKGELNSKYADIVERIMYNNLLSSVSMDGKAFFYENPLEVHIASTDRDPVANPEFKRKLPPYRRQEVFTVSCCPPNINRILARIGDFFFFERDDALIINQYGAINLDNSMIKLDVSTKYPNNGKVRFTGSNNKYSRLLLRRPWWCEDFDVLGAKVLGERDGYVEILVGESFDIEIDMHMQPYFVIADPRSRDNGGRVALCFGPSVFCIEKNDNPYELNSIAVSVSGEIELGETDNGIPTLTAKGLAYEESEELYSKIKDGISTNVRYIPYRCFANRAPSDMLVWVIARP